MAEVTPELLADVRNYLDITWQDEDGDKKLSGIIARGMSYVNDVAGEALDFAEEGKPRELLLDYVMYVRAGALADFQNNYLSELLALQMKKEAERYQAKGADV